MISHIVLVGFNSRATDAQRKHLQDAVEAFLGVVDGLLQIAQGADFGGRAQGFGYAITMIFDDRASLTRFYSSSTHKDFTAEILKPVAKKILVIDFDHAS
ncbi:Dabb family protein [Roseateles sp. NT4]|uniref:Dabb family protein n=1 Tax=Roseateles sp. NT4 TaxID=3453715 RepID=UPI003EEBB8FE